MPHKKRRDLKFAALARTIGIVAVLVVLCFSAGLYVFAKNNYPEYEIRRFIEPAYQSQRPGGGRLYGTAYVSVSSRTYPASDLGRAQVLLLRHPELAKNKVLQGNLYLATGEWKAFGDNADRLPRETRESVKTLNDLGVSYLALADTDPTYLVAALDLFKKAADAAPKEAEPKYNLIVTYRKLRLPKLAAEALQQYTKIDSTSDWYRELVDPSKIDESTTLAGLRRAVATNNLTEATHLFDSNPELCRRIAMQYGSGAIKESDSLVRFFGQQIEVRFNDKTISAMLAPLFTDQRSLTIAVRALVTKGAEAYLQGNLRESLDFYTQAEHLQGRADSPFDRLWIDINRVDTQIRAGQFDTAREALQHIISSAKKNEFTWLEAKALSIYGSTIRLASGYGQTMDLLAQADQVFLGIGASYDRVRPLYYLAVYRYGAGDQEEALRLALECLRLTDDADVVRMSSLNMLIGAILYTKGTPEEAAMFEKEALEQTQIIQNATLETVSASTLAELYASISEYSLAEQYLKTANKAFDRIPTGLEHEKAEVSLNLVRARIDLGQRRYPEAESFITKNLDLYPEILYPQLPFQVTNIVSQSLMLLAQAYSQTDRIKEARETYNQAIEVVEDDDHYLETEKLRIKFDDERRELYDSAIDFEYDQGSPEAAWTYLQRYRAKLFLEFLAQFNPDIDEVHTEALNRSRVQALVPKDTQVVEYAILKDRLLIWVVSDKLFTSRTVAISRAALEGKVQEVLQKLRKDENADDLLSELGRLLLEPINPLLDPNRTIAIIPDRALHGLPFAALKRPGDQKYLIQDFSIIESPSLTHLLATDASRPQRNALVGFGSQFNDASEAKELAALKEIYPHVETFAGAAIDKSKFLMEMDTAPVVHYAGHSATDAVDPLRSSILLDGNRYGPNSVTAVDISHQRLWKNAVVVLSSCDSSVGNSRDGVGMRGLTSAFLIGGAGSVVGSLWPVEASSTAQLMVAFHRSFEAAQMPVAKALRQAQLAFLESSPDRSHPYYWSGFVVTGNFSALR